jgi:hypothetical protein
MLTGAYSAVVHISKNYQLTTNIMIEAGKITELNINEDQFPSGCIMGTLMTTKGKPLYGTVRVYDHVNQSLVKSDSIVTGVFCVSALDKQKAYDLDILPGRFSDVQTNIFVSNVLPDGQVLEIVIPEAYAIRGMIVDRNYVALKAFVYVGNGVWKPYKGGFELYPLFPGTYKLTIQAEGYSPIVKEVTILDDDIDLGTIVLENPGITLRGKILNSHGMSCQNYLIRLMTILVDVSPGKPDVLLSAETDENGEFIISGVPEDQELCFVVFGVDESLQKNIGPFYNDTNLGSLSLSPKQYLIVELTNKKGQPVKGVYIESIQVDNNGIWYGKPLAGGILFITKRKSFFSRNPEDIFMTRYTVTDEPTNHVSITLPDSFNF